MTEEEAFQIYLKHAELLETIRSGIEDYRAKQQELKQINKQIETLRQRREELTKDCRQFDVAIFNNDALELNDSDSVLAYNMFKDLVRSLGLQVPKDKFEEDEK